jgi:hypothetical protein
MDSLRTSCGVRAGFRRAALVLLVGLWAAGLSCTRARADVLDDWNDAVLNSIRRENTAPPLAARNLAVLHLAVLEAINSIEPTPQPYLKSLPVSGPVSSETAAEAAAYRVSCNLFPSQRATFERIWNRHARTNADFTHSVTLGFAAADALLAHCVSDAAHTTVAYVPGNEPGAWRRTPPYHRPPDLPQWGSLKPFVLPLCDKFRPPPPPALDSRRYAEDLNEVRRLGGRDSPERSVYETETARFWSDFSGTITPPGHWNQIARTIATHEGLKLSEKALLLALLNVALSDAGIVCWEAKFKYNFWRPITAIQRAGEDGNAATIFDPDWQPLLTTPAFPEYLSGHSTFSGAAGEILLQFFGRDNLSFSIGSDTLPSVTRSYTSIAAVVEEIGRSRILGGIHFRSADENGRETGRKVGAWIFEHWLTARPAASALRMRGER